jgi:hypothetical protein
MEFFGAVSLMEILGIGMSLGNAIESLVMGNINNALRAIFH